MKHLKVISFTDRGGQFGKKLCGLLQDYLVELYARGSDSSLQYTELRRFAQQAMFDCDGLIFIGAAGIAIRAIAPFLRGKDEDPAVIVVDEHGQFVIPLLSGHLGGANRLAEQIADQLGAAAVITTATDINGIFAVDNWAKKNDFAVYEIDRIRYISAALLRSETVGLQTDYVVKGRLPQGVSMYSQAECGFVLSPRINSTPFVHTLHLVPRVIWVGVGCRRGVALHILEDALHAVLSEEQISRMALCGFATIDLKAQEQGLLALAEVNRLPLLTFSAEDLQKVKGAFTPSAFVQDTVGVENVCERAAVLAARGTLIRCKTVKNGVTIALATEQREVRFS